MKINFNDMPEKNLPNFKGGDGDFIARMHTDDLGKILFGKLEPGNTIGYHLHDNSSEIIYFLSGKAKCIYDGQEEIFGPGECHYCPKGHSHGLMCAENETVTFFAVVPNQ